jgi:hypothetical protein
MWIWWKGQGGGGEEGGLGKFFLTMAVISSIQKGDILEEKLYEALKDMIDSWKFIAQKRFCKIFRQKKYFSEDRKDNITFDVAIEVTFDWHTKPTTIYIFECKNHTKNRVTAAVLAWFSREVEGVWQNVIPTMVTTIWLQKSALEFAKTNRIGLIILKDTSPLDWVMPRKQEEKNKASYLISIWDEYMPIGSFVGVYWNSDYNSVGDFLVWISLIDDYSITSRQFYIPYISGESIKKIVSNTSSNLYIWDRLETKKLCSYLTDKYWLIFDFDMLPTFDMDWSEILGKTFIEENKISVSSSLHYDSGRWRFTLVHEIGHYILHRSLLQERIKEITDNENSIWLNENVVNIPRIEIQANLFALELLLPKDSFIRVVRKFLSDERFIEWYIFVDSQTWNQRNLIKAVYHLSTHFWVSRTVAKRYLIESWFVKYS